MEPDDAGLIGVPTFAVGMGMLFVYLTLFHGPIQDASVLVFSWVFGFVVGLFISGGLYLLIRSAIRYQQKSSSTVPPPS